MYKISTLFFLTFISTIISQEIPNEFLDFKLKKIRKDSGFDWSNNTTFGPTRYNNKKNKSDALKTDARFGFTISNKYKILYGYGYFTYKQNFYGYLYPRIVDNPNQINRYSGIPRDIKRGGFSSGETDMSGICYQNEWIILQFGRGRQSWGAGKDIQLGLSEKSNAYDYGMLDLDFNRLKVRYFHGFLETDTLSVNRYITGRGIEWNNNSNLLLSLCEIIIYSGKNRPIDISYFNPMSTHLELELNNRPNKPGTDGGNGIWQFSFDYMLMNKIRLSGNYLFDEFILDKEQKSQGKSESRAFSFRSAIIPFKKEKSLISCYASIISIGTNTFRHEDGYNNFVQRNNPLGWIYGSDSREKKIGVNWLHNNIAVNSVEIGIREVGKKNILNDLYDPYKSYFQEQFPSGNFETIKFISYEFDLWWKKYISIFSILSYHDSDQNGSHLNLNFGFDMYYSINRIF